MNIGIVSRWYERGGAYCALAMREALARKHQVHVLARRTDVKPVGDEWNVDALTWWGGSDRPLVDWAMGRGLNALIIVGGAPPIALRVLREKKVKLILLRMWEAMSPESVPRINETFDAVLAPTHCSKRRFDEMGIENVYHVPWGADLVKFRPGRWSRDVQEDSEHARSVNFFHPAGYGGVGRRRRTLKVVRAFAQAGTGDATLLIASQGRGKDTRDGNIETRYGTLPREELAALYRQSDVALLPSAWEGLGLTFIEAIASGLAVVTVDAPPMYEYVLNGWNGIVCKTTMHAPHPGLYVSRAEVDRADLAAAIGWLAQNPERAREMGRNSRQWAEARHDWARNGERLVEVVEEVVNG